MLTTENGRLKGLISNIIRVTCSNGTNSNVTTFEIVEDAALQKRNGGVWHFQGRKQPQGFGGHLKLHCMIFCH